MYREQWLILGNSKKRFIVPVDGLSVNSGRFWTTQYMNHFFFIFFCFFFLIISIGHTFVLGLCTEYRVNKRVYFDLKGTHPRPQPFQLLELATFNAAPLNQNSTGPGKTKKLHSNRRTVLYLVQNEIALQSNSILWIYTRLPILRPSTQYFV